MTRHPPLASILALALFAYSAFSQADDFDPQAAAGDNIGRTEEDDGIEEPDENTQLGQLGPIDLTFSLPEESVATLGLYTPAGQVVRILGQVLRLPAGEHEIRWDGMDLFGNVVPGGTELELKVIRNRPLRAYYEFSVSSPKVAPWGGSFGEGDDRRAGGWLGDHSAPNSAAAIGDQIFLSSLVVEHGDNLIAVNPDGEKLWGGKLDGWSGPRHLTTDGADLFALSRHRNTVYRVRRVPHRHDPERDQTERRSIVSVRGDAIHHLAALPDGRLVTIRNNDEHTDAPFRVSLGNGDINFGLSIPQVMDTTAPTEFHISAQAAWGNVFTTAGNPQNGGTLPVFNREGYAVVVFRRPVEVGSVMFGRMPDVARARVFTLKENLEYKMEMSPLHRSGDDILDQFDLAEFDENWELFGEVAPEGEINPAPSADGRARTVRALYIRLTPKDFDQRNWRPRLRMARLHREVLQPAGEVAAVRLPEDARPRDRQPEGGWSFDAALPVSGIYPAPVLVDFGEPVEMDGLAFMNNVNPRVEVDVFTGSGEPDPADDSAWTEAAPLRGGYNRRLGHLSASKRFNESYAVFSERTTTRAVRLRVERGFGGGKWGRGQDDLYFVEADAVRPLVMARPRELPPRWYVEVFDSQSGESRSKAFLDQAPGPIMAAADGALYGVLDGRLQRLALQPDGRLTGSPLNDQIFPAPASLTVSADRIAVGDGELRSVMMFNREGRHLATAGGHGPRQRGAWNPEVIDRPSGIAFASDGSLWVAEERFAPKRVARYSPEGRFVEEFLGPPMYGGGGRLDPDLQSFYYRSMQFALDWEAGTSRLAALNDRLHHPLSAANTNSSFAFTGIGRPLDVDGRRYLVTDSVIVIHEDDVWRPAAVMGAAHNSPFLLQKESWNRHWAKFDLTGKGFIWCDHNGDGDFQIEEVELFDLASLPEGTRSPGGTVGPDLSMWSRTMRLAPRRITEAGVPIYRAEDIRPFRYADLAPHFSGNYTTSGPRSAKPYYFGFRYITRDGGLIKEGQPYQVLADGTIRGGPVTTRPSDYRPPILGTIKQTPWRFTGGAVTDSPVGEVAAVNSNSGYWYVWAADYGVVVGTFFDGSTGGWGWGLPPERGLDVTGRKHAWEGWGGDFIRAHDGNYYAQGGKGFHAIARIEGLNDFQIDTYPVRVSSDQSRLAGRVREVIVGRHNAAARASSRSEGKSLEVPRLRDRTTRFQLDGELQDWGNRADMTPLGDISERRLFALAAQDDGIVLAFTGEDPMTQTSRSDEQLYRAEFGFDLLLRTAPRARSRDILEGDRRIVIARRQDQWVAVRYDYRDPEVAEPALRFSTPIAREHIARATRLAAPDFRMAHRDDTLQIDILSLDSLEGDLEAPTMPGERRRPDRGPATDGAPRPTWAAEIFLSWDALGLDREAVSTLRFDVGLRAAPGPDQPVRTVYWSNTFTEDLGDEAVQAMINPGAWGTFTLPRR